MKLLTLALVAAAPAFLFADGNSDTATAKAKVQIIAPVKVVSNGDIDFGQIVVDDVTKPASVTLTPSTQPNGNTNATLDWANAVNCAKFKKSGNASAAQFHYSRDITVAPNVDSVKITVANTDLTGGYGPAVKLTPNTDLPADDCALFEIKGQKEIAGYVKFAHFGVGGKLDIPAGALGKKEGTVTVTVEYM